MSLNVLDGYTQVNGDLAVDGDVSAVGGFKCILMSCSASNPGANYNDGFKFMGSNLYSIIRMPFAGSVLGFSWRITDANGQGQNQTAGSFTLQVRKNASYISGCSFTNTSVPLSGGDISFAKDTYTFGEGDVLDLVLLTNGSFAAGTNPVIQAFVFVEI